MSTEMMPTQWLAHWRANPQTRIRLFCFPYAGGSAAIFRTWADVLPKFIEVCPVELPGRGARLREEPVADFSKLVHLTAAGLLSFLNKPYVFFGHSLGALIAFELARYFRKQGLPEPVRLFASGHTAPDFPAVHAPIHHLPDPEFLAELRSLNGTPEAVLANRELMELLLPILRADFAINETYVCEPDAPLNLPISVYGGLRDRDVTRESLEAWKKHTRAEFTLQMFNGDHFFLQNNQQTLLEILARELFQYTK
jgi:medium-chain acyl-[acyl-carrier-protein] hydrolase